MKDEDPKNYKREKDYIPGIYNYCDQWCDQCRFSSRCLNCSLTKKNFETGKYAEDLGDLWDNLSETLQEALDMMYTIAREEGIEIPTAGGEDVFYKGPPAGNGFLVSIITHLSENYIGKVNEWFDSNAYKIEEIRRENRTGPTPRLITSRSTEKTSVPDDALKVIRRYQYQVYLKLERAMRSKKEENSRVMADQPKDSDGSAKVALLGVDRSISAWGGLLKQIPEQKRAILKFIVTLDQLRKRIEIEFPEARSFIRPGFDEIE